MYWNEQLSVSPESENTEKSISNSNSIFKRLYLSSIGRAIEETEMGEGFYLQWMRESFIRKERQFEE